MFPGSRPGGAGAAEGTEGQDHTCWPWDGNDQGRAGGGMFLWVLGAWLSSGGVGRDQSKVGG